MSLILPISFYSSVSQPPTDVSGYLYSVYTAPSSSPYPDYNFVFGSVDEIGSVTLSGMALLDANNNVDPYWKPVMLVKSGDYIKTHAVSAGNGSDFRFIVGGLHRFLGDPNNIFLTILNLSATSPNVFTNPSFFPAASRPDNVVNTILLDDKIYVGGYFLNPRNRFVAYNRDGTLSTITANANNVINDIKLNTINSQEIYIAGSFTTIKGGSRRSIAKLNKITNSLTSFNALGIYSSGTNIKKIQIQNYGKIIAGSNESNSSKVLIRLATNTVFTTTTYESFYDLALFGTGISFMFDAYALKIDNNGKLLAAVTVLPTGGGFTEERLYRFNLTPSISLDTTFAANDFYVKTSGSGGRRFIQDIGINSDNDIILVGNFLEVAGISRPNFAILNNSGVLQNL